MSDIVTNRIVLRRDTENNIWEYYSNRKRRWHAGLPWIIPTPAVMEWFDKHGLSAKMDMENIRYKELVQDGIEEPNFMAHITDVETRREIDNNTWKTPVMYLTGEADHIIMFKWKWLS